jgi:ABC-type transport system involved in cytochrome bd biosynthesis fused ATPase/permease subunit
VEKGEIVEQGSHEELLRMKGFYARLQSHQDGSAAVKRDGEGGGGIDKGVTG